MKKIVIIFCCISLFIFSGCVNLQKSTTNGEVSFNDSFTEELTFPFNADYQQIDFFSPDKWDLWSRTENKLFHDFSSEDEIFFVEYKALDDFSISINNEMNVSEGEIYLIASNIFLPKGNISANFILYDENDNVIDWVGGMTTLLPANGYQSLYCLIYVTSEIKKIRPRFIGEGNTIAKIKNTVLYKIENKQKKISCIENDFLKVCCDTQTISVTVTDKRNGQVYEQCSENLKGIIFTESSVLENEIQLTSYDKKGKPIIKSMIKFNSENQASLDYSLSMPPDYTFDSFSFPQKSMSKENDYLVLPINEGMCFDYNDEHAFHGELVTYSGHGLCMPFYGITNQITGAGFVSIIKNPDDCAVEIKMNKTNCVGPNWKSQKGKFGYDRNMIQTFFTDGAHVAIAKEYRKYAKENGTLVTFEEKKQKRGIEGAERLNKLMGAANIWCWYSDGKNHTADTLVSQILEAGIDRILWSNNQNKEVISKLNDLGVLTSRYDIYQDVMNPAYYNLVSYIHEDWLPQAYPNDIATYKDGSFVQAWGVERKDNKGYINCVALCDITAPYYARQKIQTELSIKNFGSRFFDTTTASSLRECYSSAHPMTRTDSRKSRFELLSISSLEHKLVTGSETGMDFVVPVCDYFEGMMSLGPYRREDAGRDVDKFFDNIPSQIFEYQLNEKRRLPLWELVYHDCCVAYWYWGDHNNTFNNQLIWDKRDNFNALYAVPPMYWIKNEEHFQSNKERFVKSYKSSAEITKKAAGTEMISHKFLTPDRTIQQTQFSNGLTVTVDFSINQISFN